MANTAEKPHENASLEDTQKALLSTEKSILQLISNGLIGVVESNRQMVRAIVVLSFLVLLAIGLLEYFRYRWKDDFELHFPLGGAAIVLHSSPNDDDFRNAVSLVPASRCWVNTGLEIKNGDRITIRASGQVHLAMKQIEQEKIPPVLWSDPDGSPFKNLDNFDRSDLLIHKHYNQDHQLLVGNLVGYFLPVGEADNLEAKPSYNKPHPGAYGGVFNVGSKLESKINDTGKTVNLWLSVNDIILENSPKGAKAYFGDLMKQAKRGDMGQLWKDKQKEWNNIVDRQAWDLYFYDNIGHYLVTIEKQ